jgi:hypothetical protein
MFGEKGVKQINNRISFKHLYNSYLSAFFFSAGVPNGEFPEILMASGLKLLLAEMKKSFPCLASDIFFKLANKYQINNLFCRF